MYSSVGIASIVCFRWHEVASKTVLPADGFLTIDEITLNVSLSIKFRSTKKNYHVGKHTSEL